MSAITTHVLDTSRGAPAVGISVVLSVSEGDRWSEVARGKTDSEGRVGDLLPFGQGIVTGTYRLYFETGPYFESAGIETFYPFVAVVFLAKSGWGHLHVPLLLSPFGYSTYRGS